MSVEVDLVILYLILMNFGLVTMVMYLFHRLIWEKMNLF